MALPFNPEKCEHRMKRHRKKLPHGRMRCLRCGREFKDVNYRVRHGTARGYYKHRYEAKGNWPWPLTEADPCGCRAAGNEALSAGYASPVRKTTSSQRASARSRALLQLKQAYPGLYMQLYRERLEEIRGRELRGYAGAQEVPLWDDLVARLVKEAMGRDEGEISERVRGCLATRQEREVTRLVMRLRVVLSQVALP